MKTHFIRFSNALLALTGSVLLTTQMTHAATYYWDSNTTTSGWGTAVGGIWTEPTTSRWTTGTNSTTATIASQTILLADSVNFGDGSANTLTGGTITVTGTVNATSITFGSSAGQIILDGGIINLAAAASITVNNATDTITSEISGAGTSLTKAGTGILVLAGTNTYTGSTIINAGTINLGGGTANGSLASTALVLGGGSLNYTRTGTNTQNFNTTSITGNSMITGAAGNTLNLGTVSRGTNNRFYDFGTTGLGVVAADTASNVAGIMSGFTVGDSWAVATGTTTAITGLGSYTLSSVAGTTGGNYTANNIDVDSSEGVLSAGITTNSLRFSEAAANTLTLTGANIISSSGILVGSGVGANLSTITGGTLTGAASKDLRIIQNNTSEGLTISSNIINSTSTLVNKFGAGRLTLAGNNTFTGGVVINQGTVALGSAGGFNSTAGSENAVTFGFGSTGTLAMNGNSAVVRSLNTDAASAGTTFVENGNAAAATLTIGNSLNLASTYGGTIQNGTGGGALKLVKAGTNTLILTGNNTFSGGFEIAAGTVQYDSASNANIWGASSNVITFTGNATLHNNNNAYTLARGIAINGVTANLTGAFGESTNITGAVTGTGTLNVTGGSNGWAVTLSNTGNTFTGAVGVYGGSGSASLSVASLGNSANAITLGTGSNGAGTFTYTGSAALNRALALGGTTSGGTFNSSGTGVITIGSNLSITNNGAKTLTLGGSNTGANTFSGSIGNSGAGATTITKADGGTWILSNATNSYTGGTNISGGTLRFVSGALGSSGTINASGGTLLWHGDNTQDISSRLAFTAAATSTFNTNGNDVTFASAIGSSNTGNFVKTGLGTLTLQGTNTFTSGTKQLNGGGTLVLDYTTNDNRKLGSGALSLGAGTIVLKGGATTAETASSTTFNTGTNGTFFVRDGGTAKINLNAFTVGTSSTVSFSHDSMATTDRTNVGGILGAWFTVGNRWASNSTNLADGDIVGYTGGTTLDLAALPAAATSVDINYDLAGGGNLSASRQFNTLRIESTADNQSLIIGANTLTVSNLTGTNAPGSYGGGLLYAGGANGNYTITDNGSTGRVATENGNGQTQLINVYSGTLTVNAIVGAGSSAFVKSGEGTLVFNKANGYTGATRVYQGVLRLTGAGSLTAGTTVQNGAAIELGNGIAIVNTSTLNITGTGISNGGALRSVATTSSSYAAAITIGTGGARINSDSTGTLTLSGGVVTSLFNNVTFGGAGNTTVSTAAISGAGGLIKDGAGTTTLSATNTYTGATTVSSGTLAVNGSITSAVTVATGGTLGGSGTITGTVSISGNGTFAAGNSIESLASGSLTLAAAAIFAYEMNNDAAAGVSGDLAAVTGNLTLDLGNASILTLTELGTGSWTVGEKLTLASYTGAWNGGLFNYGGSTVADDSTISFSGMNWTFDYNDTVAGTNYAGDLTGSNFVTLTAATVIPEPKTALLGVLGVLLLLRRRRN
jgi:autotransporter-associated beta strand protein